MDAINRRTFARIALAVPAAGWLPAGGTLDATARHLTDAWRKQGRQ